MLELAPVHWLNTLEDDETQRCLDAELFRRITIEESLSSLRHTLEA